MFEILYLNCPKVVGRNHSFFSYPGMSYHTFGQTHSILDILLSLLSGWDLAVSSNDSQLITGGPKAHSKGRRSKGRGKKKKSIITLM